MRVLDNYYHRISLVSADSLIRRDGDILIRYYVTDVRAFAYLTAYYAESMRVLDTDLRNDLFTRNGTIFTKVKDSGLSLLNCGIGLCCDVRDAVLCLRRRSTRRATIAE